MSNSILLLDTPGFQNPATCGRLAGATFEELCHNYVQVTTSEKLKCATVLDFSIHIFFTLLILASGSCLGAVKLKLRGQ